MSDPASGRSGSGAGRTGMTLANGVAVGTFSFDTWPTEGVLNIWATTTAH